MPGGVTKKKREWRSLLLQNQITRITQTGTSGNKDSQAPERQTGKSNREIACIGPEKTYPPIKGFRNPRICSHADW